MKYSCLKLESEGAPSIKLKKKIMTNIQGGQSVKAKRSPTCKPNSGKADKTTSSQLCLRQHTSHLYRPEVPHRGVRNNRTTSISHVFSDS